jgi:hypothetical protein
MTQEKNTNQEQEKVNVEITTKIDNSILPSIQEIERFILFLNKKFGLSLPNNISISIEKTSPNYKGFFRPSLNPEHIKNDTIPLNQIVLSSYHLKTKPYDTIAHEVAHFINYSNGIKDCSNSQYHNKKFKIQAEKLLLIVEKTKKGYNKTIASEDFLNMLNKEFIPSQDAFKIFQNIQERKAKKENRNLLFMCSCGCKIRTAKNQDKPLKAVCVYCDTEFKEQEQDKNCCYNNKKEVLK